MTFTDDEISSILSDFPKFELSYEMMTHKKVYDYNIILAVPDGKQCFAWFTSYKEDNVCFIMEIETDSLNKNGFNIGSSEFTIEQYFPFAISKPLLIALAWPELF